MTRGRIPKPPGKAVGHRRKRRFELVPRSDIPFPPQGLLKRNRDLWIDCWKSDLGAIWDSTTDHKAIVRLFQLYDERDRAYRGMRKEGRLARGSQGQVILSPLLKYISQLDGPIRDLEDRLGLTPRARLQLGITVVDAHRSLDELFEAEDGAYPEPKDDPRVAEDAKDA